MTTLYASSARDSARYDTRYLAQDGPEAEGVWLGRQAAGLGLDGPVATDDLEALLSGRDPATGVQLGKALVDRIGPKGKLIRAVAGFDATFSAPKSVMLVAGLDVRVLSLDGDQLRRLTVDPTRDYQPSG